MADTDPTRITDPTPDTSQMRGSTIYDWISDSHPILKKVLIGIFVLIAAYLIIRVSPTIAAIIFGVGIIGLIIGYLAFRNAYFWNDSVILLAFDSEDITSLNLYVIGKNKMRTLMHTGIVQSFTSMSGDPIYVADYFDGETIHYPWSFETSRIRFVLQAETFDEVRKIAEDAQRELNRIHSLPTMLGLLEAGRNIRTYEGYYKRILDNEESDDAVIEDIITDILQEVNDVTD